MWKTVGFHRVSIINFFSHALLLIIIHLCHWNVAGVLCAVIYFTLTDLLVEKKRERETPLWWVNELSDPKRAVFVMQIGEQMGADWTQSQGSKVELKVEAFLVGFYLCIQNRMDFCLLLVVFAGGQQLCVLCSWVQFTSSLQHLVHSK